MSVSVHHGDSREVVRMLADASLDSCVCDPPYALVSIGKRFGADDAAPAKAGKSGVYARASAGFMGQRWDTGEVAFDPDFWREVLRVLKPGAHLLAFGGTRTYHRLAAAIEDAGFEVRDAILWHYGSGFPKSHDVGKNLDKKKERCSCDSRMRGLRNNLDSEDALSGRPESNLQQGVRQSSDGLGECRIEALAEPSVRAVRHDDSSGSFATGAQSVGLLQPELPEQDLCRQTPADGIKRQRQEATGQGVGGREEPGMERRSDLSQAARELRLGEVRPLSAGVSANGEGGRLCDGASAGNGAVGGSAASARRGRAPRGSQAAEQSAQQPGTVAGQSEPQAGGAWPRCDRCGKPIVPDGLGTALKPACEIICVARRPLIGTVAANVLQHGTGALNIDGCRVETNEDLNGGTYSGSRRLRDTYTSTDTEPGATPLNRLANGAGEFVPPAGRWPANVVHDGSDEVASGFPIQVSGGTPPNRPRDKTRNTYGAFGGQENPGGIGSTAGNASRFFYTAKADAQDRLGSKHPTVKPVDLMRWLVRLVTPPGGTVLDPFAGSGTTGMACLAEGFNAILIEREAAYVADIKRRIAHVSGQDAPLFATPAEKPAA